MIKSNNQMYNGISGSTSRTWKAMESNRFLHILHIYIDTCSKVKCLYAFGTYFDKCFYF
jgi:hypothetical protein